MESVLASDSGKTKCMDHIKESVSYNPETGCFLNRKDRANQKAGGIAGNVGPNGYRTIMIHYRSYYAHHLAVFFMTGSFSVKGSHIDHRNGIKDDNRWQNLRVVAPFLNCHNRQRLNKNNTSGHAGVWQLKSGKWSARVTLQRKPVHLGNFDTVVEAVAAREAYRTSHGLS